VKPNRRAVLTGLGGIVTGSVAITALSQDASATVQVSQTGLEIPNREYKQTSDLEDVQIRVNAEWSFDAEKLPDAWELKLLVSDDGESYEQIDSARMAPSDKKASGSEELSGSLTQTSHFTINQFRVSNSNTTTQKIHTKLVFNLEVGETVVESAEATTTSELTILPGSIEAETNVQGTGEIVLSK